MRLDNDDREALEKTLARAGVSQYPRDMTCLAFSKPDRQGNKAVHAAANERLLDALLQNDVGHCIHITGEMRALADPFHRRLCAELFKRAKDRFTVIYNVASDDEKGPAGVRLWAKKWQSKSWTEKLSAINFIGSAFVDVRGYNTLNEIQYSVFGNRYVLLQEKHTDEGNSNAPVPKRVWLLDSKTLNEALCARAIEIVQRSNDVPEGAFRKFFAEINGVTAQNILSALARSGGSAPMGSIIDEDLREFDPDAADDLEALKAVGFIDSADDTLTLTSDGQRYLEAIK